MSLSCLVTSIVLVQLPDCPLLYPPLFLLSCRQVLPSTCAHNLADSDVLILIVFCTYPDRNNALGTFSVVEPKVSLDPVLLQNSGKDFP